MNTVKIPMLDLGAELLEIRSDVDAAIKRVLDSTDFIGGPEVDGFEAEVAAFLGSKYAVGCNSGTDAILLALKALGVGEGDEVITSPFSFFATAEPVSLLGAEPIFVDIDDISYNIDVDLIESKITSKTKAIIPVHLYGQPVDMNKVMMLAKKHNLLVIEDCAQAFGAVYDNKRVGTIGDAGAYSFFPSKTLGALGDGGLVVTNNEEVSTKTKMLRSHGSLIKYKNEILGYNSRLDAIQAAVLRVKLKRIDEQNKRRKQTASIYNTALAAIPGIEPPITSDGFDHVYHQYTARVGSEEIRENLRNFLSENGIASMVYYPTPIHKLPIYSNRKLSFPNSERAAKEVISLPIWPGMAKDTQSVVIEAIEMFFGSKR